MVLSDVRRIHPPLPVRFMRLKAADKRYKGATEPLLRTCELPLAAFLEREPGLDIARLGEIRFIFDRGDTGVIVLDDVSLARAPAHR